MADPTQRFRDAMSQLASGVSLLTLHRDEPASSARSAGVARSDDHGMTVTSLTSASLRPPMVTVGIGQATSMAPMITPGLGAGVSVLAERHRDLAAAFARSGRPTATELLVDVAHHRSPHSDALLVSDALATLAARVHSVVPAGDHLVVVLEVLHSATPADGAALLYHRRGYL